MKTAFAKPALAQERCQYRTTTGRQCASRILGPGFSYCVRHSFAQPPASQPSASQLPAAQPSDSQDFAAVLTENASDFQDPQGINHSLAALYKLLASGQISPRRATGLAYIASLLLRTLPAINGQLDVNKAMQYEIDVPPRGRVGCSEDEEPPTLPEPTSPGDPTAPADDNPQVYLPAVAGLPQQAPATEVPTTAARLPAGAGPPQACLPLQAVIPPPPLSPVWAGPSFERSPFRSVPIFRRPRSIWKPRFEAVASHVAHHADVSAVQLAPLQLRLARLPYSRRHADRFDLFRRFSAANPGGHFTRGIRGQARRPLPYFRDRLNIADGYCGYCLTLVTRVPVKRTNTVFDGGWP